MFKSSIFILLLILTSVIVAQIPPIMNYQGKLTNLDGVGVNDPVDITFRILKNGEPTTDSPGDTLWMDAYHDIPVVKGLFDVMLGSIAPLDLPFAEQYWIELVIDGEVLYPRVALSSVGYAFRAKYADSTSAINWDTLGAFVDSTHVHSLTLDGDISAEGIVSGTITTSIQSGAVIWDNLSSAVKDSIHFASGLDADWQIAGSNMYAIPTGNVGIGTTAPGAKLEVRKQNATSKIRITTDDGTGASGSGDVYVQYDLAGGGMSPGAYIWTTGIDNSDGQKFKISGAPDAASPGFNDKLTITGAGRVGILTTNPNEALTIQGRLSLFETTTPTTTPNYGKLYAKSSDSKLYFMDDAGVEYDLTSGDDWGTQAALTTARISGNGTSGNELDIARQGATTGQVLKWDGSSWAPGDALDSGMETGRGAVSTTAVFYTGRDLKLRWNSSSNTIEASTDSTEPEGVWSNEYQTHNSTSSLNMNGGDVSISIGSWTTISAISLSNDWASTSVWISKKNSPFMESYKIELHRHGSQFSWIVWRIPPAPGPFVFVSSNTFMAGNCSGGIYGFAGACDSCEALAATAGLSGTFKAILSDAGGNAVDRLDLYNIPYYNLNGNIVSNDSSGFWDGSLDNAIVYDENGVARGGWVWTGSNANGLWIGDLTNRACANWTSCDPLYMMGGRVGNAGSTNSYWLSSDNPGCNTLCRIYCIQVK